MSNVSLARIGRVLRMPPQLLVKRMLTELNAETDRFRAPRRARLLDGDALATVTGSTSVDDLWSRLLNRVYALPIRPTTPADYERACPGDAARILAAADAALARKVDLLGSGPVALSTPIDWHRDVKTGDTWPPAFMRDIKAVNFSRPSDVKVPWEISRVQWLIPAGQAYLLTGDERYAVAARNTLEDWIDANPYAHSVNWACTMEAAMRVFTWTWFFHAFGRSASWSDSSFRSRFLRTLYLHGEFTERYIERSEINGNHFTADAAALVFAGLFFGEGDAPRRWADEGWRMLCEELPRQVFADGVDFEASTAYHRLVLELFFLAARYREARGLDVPDAYRDRIVDMARFTLAYTRPDGSAPLTGDADDARVLPFGGQPLTDHRYLAGFVGAHWGVQDLVEGFTGSRVEIFWTLGQRAAASLGRERHRAPLTSTGFPNGGFYIMRNGRDHVFIDCGPVGQAGRGGHGHNDCLSFEAVLDGEPIVADCGAYLYTADAHERNRFRSTAFHNTPQVDGEELNRFVRWDHLWTLHNDAAPEVLRWEPGAASDVFVGTHTGYERLGAIHPIRTIVLDHARHALTVTDEITGSGEHEVSIPLHLAPGVRVVRNGDRHFLVCGKRRFTLTWSSDEAWVFAVEDARVSPRYGVAVPTVRLLWKRTGALPASLTITIEPVGVRADREPSGDLVTAA